MDQNIKNSILIQASPGYIWDMLTNDSALLEGMTSVSDWHRGSANDYYLNINQSRLRIWKGSVTEAIEPYFLEQKVFSNLWNIPDVPENYLTTQYIICPVDDCTMLTVIQKDFKPAPKGDRRYLSALNWWRYILPKIQVLAEKANPSNNNSLDQLGGFARQLC